MEYVGFLVFFGILAMVIGFGFLIYQNHSVNDFVNKAQEITYGMTKEEVFQLLKNEEPREITKNKAKGTERYRWSVGRNYYSRTYFKGTGTSIGSSNHGRRHITVVFKDNKVIEISIK